VVGKEIRTRKGVGKGKIRPGLPKGRRKKRTATLHLRSGRRRAISLKMRKEWGYSRQKGKRRECKTGTRAVSAVGTVGKPPGMGKKKVEACRSGTQKKRDRSPTSKAAVAETRKKVSKKRGKKKPPPDLNRAKSPRGTEKSELGTTIHEGGERHRISQKGTKKRNRLKSRKEKSTIAKKSTHEGKVFSKVSSRFVRGSVVSDQISQQGI